MILYTATPALQRVAGSPASVALN